MMCQMKKVPLICSGSGSDGAGSDEKKCTGPSCCGGSTCWASAPGLSCSSSRGHTECVGRDLFPFPTAGTCKCKNGNICSSTGSCVAGQGGLGGGGRGGFMQNFEMPGVQTSVPPEDFTGTFIIL